MINVCRARPLGAMLSRAAGEHDCERSRSMLTPLRGESMAPLASNASGLPVSNHCAPSVFRNQSDVSCATVPLGSNQIVTCPVRGTNTSFEWSRAAS